MVGTAGSAKVRSGSQANEGGTDNGSSTVEGELKSVLQTERLPETRVSDLKKHADSEIIS